MSPQMDYYKVLQVDPSAEPEVIDAAYKRLMRKYHPDINKSPDASDKAKAINEAFDCLKDPILRRQYDANRQSNEYHNKASTSGSQNNNSNEERRRRENAEREAYTARQQAEKERSNAEYEREKRRKAEAAAQEAQQQVRDYRDIRRVIRNIFTIFQRNRSKVIIIGSILLGMLFLSQLFNTVYKIFNVDSTNQPSLAVTKTLPTHTTNNLPTITPNPINNESTHTISPIPTQNVQINMDPLFKDDFSNIEQTKNQWENDETDWIIVDEIFRFVDNGRVFAGDNKWTDYTFSVNVMSQITIDKIIFFRYTDNLHTYYVFLRSSPINDIVLARTTPDNPDKILTSVPFRNFESTWYSLKVVLQGNSIRIYVDDVLAIHYIDSESPLENGRIGLVANLTTDQNSSVFFDDVMVSK